jgi:hypothetical protein
MHNNELISISDYAALKGISKQAVYKQLNNRLKPFLIEVDNRKYISVKALSQEEQTKLKGVEQPSQPFQPQVEQPSQPSPTFFEQQIAEKDKQIESLLRQIETLQGQNTQLTSLLQNSQVLLAQQNQLLLGATTEESAAKDTQEPQEERKKKKGFKLFGRKNK